MTEEVSVMELLDKYMISSDGKTTVGFSKSIILNDGTSQYSGKLSWDDRDGYSMYWDTPAPPEADRPEFEYSLDSITEMDN